MNRFGDFSPSPPYLPYPAPLVVEEAPLSLGLGRIPSKPSALSDHLLEGLRKQYVEGQNTDVKLLCQDKEFRFYKVVLASYSDVFQVIITNVS